MDLGLLQGIWKAVLIEQGGNPVPPEVAASIRYVFDGERVRLFEGEQPAGEGVIRLEPDAEAKAFDFEATAARKRARSPAASTG